MTMHKAIAYAILLAANLTPAASAQEPPNVKWDPGARPTREADTLFLPDFSSWQKIEAEGGFLAGPSGKTSEHVKDNFEFGPGKFGPAVKGKSGPYNFVFYPVNGLLDADEFTLEFWARWDKPWSALETGRPIFAVTNQIGNDLQIMPYKGEFQVLVQSLPHVAEARFAKTWQKSCDDLKLVADAWHAVALTLKSGTLRVYVNGAEVGQITDVRLLPVWSDDTRAQGIQIGGAPGNASGFWISDLRISRTARVPGNDVALRSVEGSLVVDAKINSGSVPVNLLAALHPSDPKLHTPAQTKAAIQAVRTDKLLTATPMKRGGPDEQHPMMGKSGKFSYDWQVVDRTFAWLDKCGTSAYISIDSTPSLLGGSVKPFSGAALANDLSSSSGFGQEPPNDLADWELVVGDLVHHVLREKKHTVQRWTVWNEPDDGGGFWNAGLERYLDLYAATARAVRGVDPKARIGGPENATFSPKWIKALFARCAKDKLPLDFIAYHDYSGDLNHLDWARVEVDALAKAAGFATPFPIVVGEFNWSADNVYKTGVARFNQGRWHLRAVGAAYTTAYLTRMIELPGFEQLVYSHTTYGNPRDGGWASTQLLGPRGEQWAPYNAYRGWKKTVGPDQLATAKNLPPGVFALATCDPATGRLGLVLANYGWAQRQTRTVNITIRNAAPGKWKLKRFLVDPKHSSRWDAAEDRDEGKSRNDLEAVEERPLDVAVDNPLTLRVELPAWSSTFIIIEPTR